PDRDLLRRGAALRIASAAAVVGGGGRTAGQSHEGRHEGRGENSAHKGPPGPRSVVGTRCEIRNQCRRNGGVAILERGHTSSYRRLSLSESPPCPPNAPRSLVKS